MPEFKCKIDPLDTSNEAPLVKFERDLELKLQSTVADDDLLSAFAIAILKGESQINGMKNDKATVITVNLDLGPIFEQVQRKILEEMKNAVTLITTGPLPTPVAPTVQVTTISHRLTDDSELKISFKVSGKDANQEEAVADILTDLGADAYRFPIDFTAVPAMEVPVVADFNNMLVGTIVKWRNAQARLKLAILDNLPDDIKTQMYELKYSLQYFTWPHLLALPLHATMKALFALPSTYTRTQLEEFALQKMTVRYGNFTATATGQDAPAHGDLRKATSSNLWVARSLLNLDAKEMSRNHLVKLNIVPLQTAQLTLFG